MLEFLIALALRSEPRVPLPPYVAVDSLKISQDEYNRHYAVAGDHLFSSSRKECVAVDLKSMKRLWSVPVSKDGWCDRFLVDHGTLYVSTLEDLKGTSDLVALEENTGRVLWRYECSGHSSAMAVANGRIHVVTAPRQLSAIDVHTHKPVWNLELPGEAESFGCASMRVCGPTLIVNYSLHTSAYRLSDGKPLWVEEQSHHLRDSLVVHDGVVWMASGKGSVAREAASGRVLWRGQYAPDDFGTYQAGKFFGLDSNQVACLDAKTGKTIWATPKPKAYSSEQGAQLGGYLFALDHMYASSGKVVAQFTRDNRIGLPCWTDGKVLLCVDHDKVVRYRHGEMPPLPKDRRGEVERLLKNFDGLDAQGRHRLVLLGDASVEPVLRQFMQACRVRESDPRGTYARSDRLLLEILKRVCQRKHTGILTTALADLPPKDTDIREAFHILADVGDPALVAPFFLQELEKNKYAEEPLAFEFVAAEYISNSSTPEALKFMFRQLKDPESDFHARAYFTLAGTGGPEGVREVLAQRRPRKLLRPLQERLNLGFLDAGERAQRRAILKEATDSSGRTWCLLQSGILGRMGDLWVSEKVAGVWSRPVFTNVWSKLAPENWLESLAGKTELAKDTDSDGLSDLEEARLGTDPARSDTDGDGDSDELDPWPNAAVRAPASDAEKALAAAFEANYHFSRGEGAGVFVAPADLPPLELTGYSGPMIWRVEGQTSALQDCYPEGVGLHGLEEVGKDDASAWQDKFIAWNADRSEAKFCFTSSYGRLNAIAYYVTVRRFGDEWVVVSKKMAWVS